MKLIFLDIDGVLNPTHYMNAMYKLWKASFNEIKSHDEYGLKNNPLSIQEILYYKALNKAIEEAFKLI